MRFEELTIERYGAFAERSLSLREQPWIGGHSRRE